MNTIKSGIYIITNTANDKIYIGSAFNLSSRMASHKYTLKNNKHKNPHLQSAYNLYGEDKFLFEILEFVEDKNKILEREQHYLDFYLAYDRKIGYNICKIAGNTSGVKPSKETRRRMSEAAKNRAYKPMPEHQKKLLSEMFSGVGKKIDWSIVKAIRETYSQGGVTQKQLAEEYGLFQTTVSEIIRNIIWVDEDYTYQRKRNKKENK
jgi:group I intron endonuclease